MEQFARSHLWRIRSHIRKNVGQDDVGHTGIRITSEPRRKAGLSELIRDRVGLVGGGDGDYHNIVSLYQ